MRLVNAAILIDLDLKWPSFLKAIGRLISDFFSFDL